MLPSLLSFLPSSRTCLYRKTVCVFAGDDAKLFAPFIRQPGYQILICFAIFRYASYMYRYYIQNNMVVYLGGVGEKETLRAIKEASVVRHPANFLIQYKNISKQLFILSVCIYRVYTCAKLASYRIVRTLPLRACICIHAAVAKGRGRLFLSRCAYPIFISATESTLHFAQRTQSEESVRAMRCDAFLFRFQKCW